jgi:hypothetical protein
MTSSRIYKKSELKGSLFLLTNFMDLCCMNKWSFVFILFFNCFLSGQTKMDFDVAYQRIEKGNLELCEKLVGSEVLGEANLLNIGI